MHLNIHKRTNTWHTTHIFCNDFLFFSLTFNPGKEIHKTLHATVPHLNEKTLNENLFYYKFKRTDGWKYTLWWGRDDDVEFFDDVSIENAIFSIYLFAPWHCCGANTVFMLYIFSPVFFLYLFLHKYVHLNKKQDAFHQNPK